MELRTIIWKLTLQPRVVEIQFDPNRGFYNRVPTPAALRVCKDSRAEIIKLYPTCFGNHVYPPSTLFNFRIDTLYVDECLQTHTLLLLASLKDHEMKGLRFMAIDHWINEDTEIGGNTEVDTFKSFKKILPAMPSMQALQVVYNLECWGDTDFPGGSGPMELFEEWPDRLKKLHCCLDYLTFSEMGFDECDEDELLEYVCDDHYLPESDEELAGVDLPIMGSIWGWRPTKD